MKCWPLNMLIHLQKYFLYAIEKRRSLDDLLNHSYTGSMENIFTNAKVHEILLYSLDCLVDEKEEGFRCKFLVDNLGVTVSIKQEKFYPANGDPITIKEPAAK